MNSKKNLQEKKINKNTKKQLRSCKLKVLNFVNFFKKYKIELLTTFIYLIQI